MKILFFATLKDRAGTKELTLDVPDGLRVADLKDLLAARMPAIADSLPTALVSINRSYAFGDDLIPAGAEIALFPPVSGG